MTETAYHSNEKEFASNHQAYWGGMREAAGMPLVMVSSAKLGFGSLARDSGLSPVSALKQGETQAYAAVDAWPLADLKGGLDGFNDKIVRGAPVLEPRVVSAPIRIPLPLRPSAVVGSIYSNQSILENRFFDDDQEVNRKQAAET